VWQNEMKNFTRKKRFSFIIFRSKQAVVVAASAAAKVIALVVFVSRSTHRY
jgi:hypothetical protein